MTDPHDPPRLDEASPPTDQEVDQLVTKAAGLLDELRGVFAEIKTLLEGGAP